MPRSMPVLYLLEKIMSKGLEWIGSKNIKVNIKGLYSITKELKVLKIRVEMFD
jgi:hypothetical protein